jgi:hypothetical protein
MNYFKEMNEVENDDIEIVINLNDDSHDDVYLSGRMKLLSFMFTYFVKPWAIYRLV